MLFVQIMLVAVFLTCLVSVFVVAKVMADSELFDSGDD